MNKTIKVIMFFLIILILSFFGYLTFYKFTKRNQEEYYKIELSNYKFKTYDINYEKEYKEHIMYSMFSEIEFYINDESNVGRLYIDSNKNLNITLDSVNKKLLENVKFNTLHNNLTDKNLLNAYALSEDGKLYHIILIENNIEKVNIENVDMYETITNFTDLKIKNYLDTSNSSLVVFTSSGNMYDIYMMGLYNDKIVNINDEYILYEDMSISDMHGKMFISNGKNIKVKNIIIINEKGVFEDNPSVIIITDDNRITYSIYEKVYEYNKLVSKIDNVDNKLVITFKDKSKIEFNGTYDEELFNIK